MPHLGMPQAAAGSAHTCGVQDLLGHRFLFFLASPLAFLLLRGQLLLGPQSSVRRRVRLLPFSVGHFLSSFLLVSFARYVNNSLLRMFSPSLGNVPAFAPVELSLTFPHLLVLRLGLNSPHVYFLIDFNGICSLFLTHFFVSTRAASERRLSQ